jgi:hypothetical protein
MHAALSCCDNADIVRYIHVHQFICAVQFNVCSSRGVRYDIHARDRFTRMPQPLQDYLRQKETKGEGMYVEWATVSVVQKTCCLPREEGGAS